MSFEAMTVVFCAAALHACWNALVRSSSKKFLDTMLIVLGGGIWALFLLPLIPFPAVESWPYLAASVLIHVVYFSLIALSYKSGELSLVYPLMRGTAPALSAVGAVLIIHESPSFGGWAGVILISVGVLILAGDSYRLGTFNRGSAGFALGNAFVFAHWLMARGCGFPGMHSAIMAGCFC